MTLDSLPDLDTSGLYLVKTHSTALTCWPYRNMALRDGARTSTRTSSVAKGRTASIHCRPAPPRQTEALSSRTSRSRPWKRRSQAGPHTQRLGSRDVDAGADRALDHLCLDHIVLFVCVEIELAESFLQREPCGQVCGTLTPQKLFNHRAVRKPPHHCQDDERTDRSPNSLQCFVFHCCL